MTLLSVENLSLTFPGPVQAVKNVSFTVAPGEMLALVGESGSGKSLTALSCLGLQPNAAEVQGRITLNGTDILAGSDAQLRRLRGCVAGMIFQEPMTALNPLHTIGRQIAEAIRIHRPKEATRSAVAVLLEEVGLTYLAERLEAYPHQLSGGERQRVMIAMAIANRPQLLIADEPTTAVDVTVQAKILKLLKKLQDNRGMAMLFITHDLTLVKRFADRVAVMKQGEIVEQGKVEELFAVPKHPYTQTLLASEPKGHAVPLPKEAKQVVACEDLRVYFPRHGGLMRRVTGFTKAVDEVSLQLREGETLGLVGESGSGKTTLAMALLRLAPSQGRILFLSKEIQALQGKALKPLRRQLQVVFQDPFASLNPRMTVRQIVEEGLRVHEPALTQSEREARVTQALTDVGLEASMLERYPHAFSGGQRQRIAIARALVLNPVLVVLDEPTSALDLTVQSQIIELLRRLQAERGLAYLFISHDLRVVRALAHRIAVLKQGKLVEEGEAQGLLSAPREEYTRTLVAAALLKKEA